MAPKSFSNNNLKKNPRSVKSNDAPAKSSVPEAPKTEAKPKKKVGRPKTKTEECKTVNIAIPISLLEQVNVAKKIYNDNMTLYINKLIERDLEENSEKYKLFAEMQMDALK